MAKQHKLANARIEIDSGLPIDRVLEIARHAVGTQKSLRIIGEGEGGIRVALNGLLGGALMNFVVTAEAEGGRSRVISAIEAYRTSQTTVYFIPVGPKSLEGIGIYRRFMTTFGQAMQAADPSARIQMIEREDRAPSVSAPAVAYDAAAAQAAGAPAPAPVVPAPAVPAALGAPAPGAAPHAAPAVLPGFPSPPGAVTTPAGISESTARIVQIAGGVVFVGGLIFWYTTPGNVVVGPLLVVLLGAVIAGIGFLLGRRANSAAADELAAKLRQERALNGAGMAPASSAAVPGPPVSGPAVPVPVAVDPSAPPVPAPSHGVPSPDGFAVSVPSQPVSFDASGDGSTLPSEIPPVPLPPSASSPSGSALLPLPPVPVAPASAPLPEAPAMPAPAVPSPSEPVPPTSIAPAPVPLPPASAPVVSPAPVLLPSAPAVPAKPIPQSASGLSGGLISSIPGPSIAAPVVPSIPDAPASGTAPVAPVPVPAFDEPEDDDLDATRVATPAPAVWLFVLADGRSFPITALLRLGRDPIADQAEPGALLVPLADPAKSISKTHAEVRLGTSGLLVRDLHSTNGTVVVVEGVPTQVAPERPQPITADAELRLGEYAIRILRQAPAGLVK
ncbi:MAG: FHA domain-containing protein [Actinobacteria bacterium]|nr:FHA domain-containing protein [Actinomycetota bacterium]